MVIEFPSRFGSELSVYLDLNFRFVLLKREKKGLWGRILFFDGLKADPETLVGVLT